MASFRSDELVVSTEQLRATAQSYRGFQQQFQNAYLQMSNEVRVSDGYWDGDASEAFKAQFDALYKNLSQTEQTVQNAVNAMEQAAEIFEEAETGVVEWFEQLSEGTSPFA